MWLSLLTTCLISTTAVAGLEFESTPQHKNASLGQSVLFLCSVSSPYAQVQWWFVDHNQQLTDNMRLTVSAAANYALVRPEGAIDQWNLQISPITKESNGTYECRVGDNMKQASTLNIIDSEAVSPPPPDEIPHVNYTDCCVNEGISESCKPACNPGTLPLVENFNPMVACAEDLPVLIKCGADGRNHVPCCRRRRVTEDCLDWCLGSFPETFDFSQAQCMMQADKIVGCFEEGHLLLPTPPVFVRANAESPTSISVNWEVPQKNGDTVQGYKVFYRKTPAPEWKSTESTTLRFLRLSELQAEQEYELYVMAFNPHGASLPSYTVTLTMPAVNTNPNEPAGDGTSLKDCCKSQQMSDHCVDYLCGGLTTPVSQDDAYDCVKELDKVFTCLGGQQDHTDCCKRRNVLPGCLPLCAGQLLEASLQNTQCVDYLPDINSCAQENRDSIPSPPVDVVLFNAGSTAARIQWQAPLHNANLVTEYVVHLHERGTEQKKEYVTMQLTIVLSGLKPGTLYDARVVSVGDEGSSVPSPGVVFLTYQAHGGIRENPRPSVAPPTEPPQYDIAECCQREGVKDECKFFCSYDTDLSEMDSASVLERAVMCEEDIGKVYMCAAAGRDHTSCCRRRGLEDICLPYCAFSAEDADNFQLDFSHASCLNHLGDVQQCLEEGLVSIPSPPRELTAHSYTSHTVSLEWTQPESRSSKVIGYRLLYAETDEVGEQRQINIAPDALYVIVSGLQPDTQYSFSVVAKADAGTSLPSAALILRTKPQNSTFHIRTTVPTDLTDCCEKKNVSAGCVHVCASTTVLDLHTCGSSLGSLISCAADERDHSMCCSRRQVPSQCHGFCRGQPKVADFTSLLCVMYTEQILSCFREGFDLLPFSPEGFHLKEVSTRSLTVAWQDNENNTGRVVYELYHKKMWESNYMVQENVTSPYTLDDLEPFTHYNVYVVTLNNYGISLPTPTMTVWTEAESKPAITIDIEPDTEYLKEHQKVVLACAASGTPEPTVHWLIPNTQAPQPPRLVIDEVSRSDTGRYVCVADNGIGGRAAQDIYLKVQFPLEVTVPEDRLEVEPNKGLIAELRCIFRGYPDTITWLKGPDPFPPVDDTASNRFWKSPMVDEAKGTVESVVTISNVREEDYAAYTCRGENSNGESNGKVIALVNPLAGPGNPTPSLPLPPRQLNLTACCMEAGVRRVCQPACSFDIDLTTLTKLDNPLECFDDIEKIIRCGADGKNHSTCCASKNVPAECQPYCSGIVDPSTDHFTCLSHIEVIVDCMEEGNARIPSAPQALKARLTSHGYIQVWFDGPLQNSEYVSNYVIYYQAGANGEKRNVSLTYQHRRANLPKIHSYTLYNIYVVATNHHGQSAPSKTVRVETFEQLPSQPRNLDGHFLEDKRTLHLTWNEPSDKPGAVISYVIFYSIAGKNSYSQRVTDKLFYDLTDLAPGETYNIHVDAKTKHLETDKSNVLVKTVPGEVGEKSGHSSTGKKVGTGIGIALALIVVFVAVGLGGYFYYKMRVAKPNNRFDESVAFENPSYSKPGECKITGLPGGNGAAQSGAAAAGNKLPMPADNPASPSAPSDPYSNLGAQSPPDAPNGQYASLNMGGADPVDSGKVNVMFDSSQS